MMNRFKKVFGTDKPIIGMLHLLGSNDEIVVTGAGTGIQTDMQKILEFKELLPDFPLIVGAGMTAETCAKQLAAADGGIVGSYFKYNGNAHGRMDKDRVEAFMYAATGGQQL